MITEEAKQRRKRLDHERYMRNRCDRILKQKAYDDAHREHIRATAKRRYLNRIGLLNSLGENRAEFTKNLQNFIKQI